MGLEEDKRDTCVVVGQDEDEDEDEWESRETTFVQEERDVQQLNRQLQIGFEDVIGEPSTNHSFDSVWVGSHSSFELIKYVLYKMITTLLAVPTSFIAGIFFALLSCVHIWLVTPVTQGFFVVLPLIRSIWNSWINTFLSPLASSFGLCIKVGHR
ncbi:caveolin-2-like [Arapaima gigas]